MSKILLADGSNNFIRNYASVPFINSEGEPWGGTSGFILSLGYFVRICQPDSVIIIWDGASGSQKRRSIIPEYKSGRKPIKLNRTYDFELINEDDNKLKQRLRLREYLNDLPLTQITVDNIEADDTISFLVQYFSDDDKIIVSNDKDFYQLLSNKIFVFRPTSKVLMTEEKLLDQFKIYPHNFALARAIVGDPSDSLPGIKGIGLSRLIKYFPFFTEEKKITLDQLFEFCEKKDEKYKKFLENDRVVINNLKVMQLTVPMIGLASVQEIKKALRKKIGFNRTSFRAKLLQDGIDKVGNTFFKHFTILNAKAKR